MAQIFTDQSIKEIISGGKPVVVDFWAPWCGPCKMVSPIVEELANEYDGKVEIGKLNVDENVETSEIYGIRNIPTLLFFKNGELVDKYVGAVKKDILKSKIETLL
ncbi:MAG: thioredoxin [Paludibacter sp.]|nr:thioredoxin [Paludibacter sp.]